MGLIEHIVSMHAESPEATQVLVSARYHAELQREYVRQSYGFLAGYPSTCVIDGLRVVRDMPRSHCRNCGAPVEPNVCSYCKTPSDVLELR